MYCFDHGEAHMKGARWNGGVAWRRVAFHSDLRERQWTTHPSNPQGTMADNRQWRRAASSRFPKRIASGSRTTQVTAASAKQSHERYLELAREAQRVGD